MRLRLTRLENIALTIIITLPTLSSLYLLFLVRPGGYIVALCAFYFYKFIGIRETDSFFAASGVQLTESTSGQFQYRRAAFVSQLKSKCGNILAGERLQIISKIDGAPVLFAW